DIGGVREERGHVARGDALDDSAEKEHPDGAADAEDRVPDDGTERGDDDDRAAPDAVGKAAEDRSREERTERADALERTYPDGEAGVVRREVALHDEGHHGEDDR